MGLEATSWGWLRDGIKKRVPAFSLLERVENGVGTGMADVNYCIRGTEGWIELKAVLMPKRDATPVLGEDGLNPDQVNWHLARQQVLSKTWVFVSTESFRWLVSGAYAREINNWTRDDFCVKARMWYDERWEERQWRELINALVGIGYEPRLKG